MSSETMTHSGAAFAVPELYFQLAALAICAAGVFMLWYSWQQKRRSTPLHTLSGWLLILAATPMWIMAAGPEFGITYNLIALNLVALSLIFWKREQRVYKAAGANKTTRPGVNTSSRARKWSLFFSVALYAGLVSCLITILGARILPMQSANQMAFAALFYPVLWSILSVWLCTTPSLLRAFIILTLAGIASGLAIMS